MKHIAFTLSILFTSLSLHAQIVKDYNPSIQRSSHMQYFKPTENHLFAGDCMPYFHNGTFYLYWLLDEGHHSGLGGLGGHQWALSTTQDLVNWKHHPVAVGIDEEWEKSICTGSVIADKGKFYAFYSTRVKENDQVHEQLSYAISTDEGKTYTKQHPNPFYHAPQECVSRDFRDPKVFKDSNGIFHLFISGYMKEPVLNGFGGYLVHLTSGDMKKWKEENSPLRGQVATPECSDYFKWNDWYYLMYSVGSDTHYLKSKQPYGPWEYPESQTLNEAWGNVYKTAEFTNGRRIAVAFIPGKKNNKDTDGEVFGGNILFRELHQQPDGTLNTQFLPEVMPDMTTIPTPAILSETADKTVTISKETIQINASNNIGVASISVLPENYRITMNIDPLGNYDELGLFVRATDRNQKGYKLELNTNKQLALIHNTVIESVDDLRKPITLDVIVCGDFIDANINHKRCIINRLPEQKGKSLFFFVKNGNATIRNIKIQEIKN